MKKENTDQKIMFSLLNIFTMMSAVDRLDSETLNLTLLQFRIMLLIKDAEGISVGEIAKLLYVNPAAISPQLDKLEKMNWIERFHDSKDRRIVRVRLTKRKKSELRKDFKKRSAVVSDFLNDFSTKEKDDLANSLVKLENSIERYFPIEEK